MLMSRNMLTDYNQDEQALARWFSEGGSVLPQSDASRQLTEATVDNEQPFRVVIALAKDKPI